MEHDLLAMKSDNNTLISRLTTISAAKWIDEISDKFEIYEVYEIEFRIYWILSIDCRKDVGPLREYFSLNIFEGLPPPLHQSYEPAKQKEEVDSSPCTTTEW